MFLIGYFLFDNVMGDPEGVKKYIEREGGEYRCNTCYAIRQKDLVMIGDLWDEDEPIYMPYEKLCVFLDKWRAFLDINDEPEKLVITMDDEYNFEFEYVLNGEKKVI